MMLGRSKNKNTESEAQEPLLGRDDDRVERSEVVFAIDDEDEGSSAFRDRDSGGRGPVAMGIGPPLRSTMQSREAEFELDSDVLDPEDEVTSIPASQRMPLLVGLADASEVRRNPDLPMHTFSNGQTGSAMVNGRVVFDDDDLAARVDLTELAAQQHKGGNMLDSMFNMANSILGAGIIGLPYAVSQAGFVTGILLLVILAGVTDWTIRLIVRNAKLSGRTSYIDIMGHCYGSSGRAAVSFFQFAFAFGGERRELILNDAVINIARFCFGANMVTTTPMELMVCREVIEEYFFAHEPFDQTRHVLFTTSILFASMAVALVTCDLGVMLEITGGASATALAFVFPALCYIKLLPAREPWNGRVKLPAIVCAAFGVLVLVLSIGLALHKAWGPEGTTRLCA
ncbi:unnamed protein product [Rhizoctonia solani]|uniref:Amino acid transporter transmembrane domain-containing protein n=1 Tax=Rhizoctonia solani TaxID=456999 RepID=A0A8H3BBA6_9AGAM|nr:unnamed protein product [Rhizoctonia solani]